jgi:hypothetical protein
MDGAKRKSISAPELYAAIDTAKAPLVVDAKRAPALDAGPPMIIGAVRCPSGPIDNYPGGTLLH